MVGVDEVELNHELATVTDTERESVLASVELVERLLSLRVVEECACPTLSRTENVRVREATAEDDHVHVLECLTTGDKVGHHNVLHVEASEVERVSHLAFAVSTLLADDGSLDARRCAAVGRDAIALERALERRVELHLNRLLLVVVAALCCASVEALVAVEQVRCLVPCVAQCVDVECMCVIVLLDDDSAFCRSGVANLCVADSVLLHVLLELLLVLV